ncbi:hypothetical protein VP242E401_P0075 [Vibrio phage 242E40-1]|nr:hypothetical protein VP242E401_P0075 [Vibrio phage 242E40-1]
MLIYKLNDIHLFILFSNYTQSNHHQKYLL